MENAADFLKIVFAMFVFILAVTLAFMMISQARETADVMLFVSDETNYFEYQNYDEEKTVGIDTVISSIYRYYDETYAVKIVDENNNTIAIFDTALEKDAPWSGNKENYNKSIQYFLYGGEDMKINGRKVCLEGQRGEITDDKEYCLGDTGGKNFLEFCGNDCTFKESFDIINYSGKYMTEGDTTLTLASGGTKTYVTYTIVK